MFKKWIQFVWKWYNSSNRRVRDRLSLEKKNISSSFFENYQFLKKKCYRYWYEEDKFDCSALSAFCQYLAKIEAISLGQLKDLHFIQEQILKHLVWHFDSQDLYTISDLPSDYGKYLYSIECEINELFGRLDWIL